MEEASVGAPPSSCCSTTRAREWFTVIRIATGEAYIALCVIQEPLKFACWPSRRSIVFVLVCPTLQTFNSFSTSVEVFFRLTDFSPFHEVSRFIPTIKQNFSELHSAKTFVPTYYIMIVAGERFHSKACRITSMVVHTYGDDEWDESSSSFDFHSRPALDGFFRRFKLVWRWCSRRTMSTRIMNFNEFRAVRRCISAVCVANLKIEKFRQLSRRRLRWPNQRHGTNCTRRTIISHAWSPITEGILQLIKALRRRPSRVMSGE